MIRKIIDIHFTYKLEDDGLSLTENVEQNSFLAMACNINHQQENERIELIKIILEIIKNNPKALIEANDSGETPLRILFANQKLLETLCQTSGEKQTAFFI